ncbi:MAG: peptide/nickel transport system ATP-binding protein [Bradymonadia bacterium]|jgi:peptide/nickel transport system ATP-binding protein
MTALFEARGLRKTYAVGGGMGKRKRLRAVHDVDLDLYAGKTLAVVGESGSGKSTIGRLLARLEDVDAGVIKLDGQPLPKRTKRAFRQRVQVVFQDPFGSLNPVHSILHHVARPLLLHGKATKANVRAKAIALLDRVGLSPGVEYVDRMPHALSGGQRQRVAVARALAPDPDVIIADEPTSMLDVSSRLSLLQVLKSIVEGGVALMLITHDLAAARYLADDVLVLYAGQVVEAGPIADVIDRPAHPYTRLLLSAVADGATALDLPPASRSRSERTHDEDAQHRRQGGLGDARPQGSPKAGHLIPSPGQPDRVAPLVTCPFLNRCPDAVPACQSELPPIRELIPVGRVLCHREDPREV